MNKVIMMAAVFAVGVGIANADLSVKWFNGKIIVDDGSGGLADGAKVQLLWSQTGIQTAGGGTFAVENGALLAGEFLLQETVTLGSGGGQPANYGLWSPLTGVWGNADVGGADINTGFFYTRIFNTTGVANESFLDYGQVDASAWVYDDGATSSPPVPDPATIYQLNALPGADFTSVALDLNGSTVVAVPEPATFGMMGVAALGMFLARKKNRR
jgi:hypothetical protein